MSCYRTLPGLWGILLLFSSAGVVQGWQSAEEPADAPAQTIDDREPAGDAVASPRSVAVLLTDLAFPGGLAIQPDTGAVHFVEHGTGRVRRLTREAEAASETVDVLTGLPPRRPRVPSPTDAAGAGSAPASPLDPGDSTFHIGFLTQHDLLVATGQHGDEEGWLRNYRLPAGDQALSADPLSPNQSLPASERLLDARGLTGMLVTANSVVLLTPSETSPDWLARAERLDDDLGPVQALIAPREPAQHGTPRAVTIDPQRNLVVSVTGTSGNPPTAELLFCHGKTGEVWVRFATGLEEIVALAYHPQTGRLYALDFARSDPSQGGLFELVATRQRGQLGVAARKVLPLRYPSSMTFSSSGALYVTQWESSEASREQVGGGQLLRIEL